MYTAHMARPPTRLGAEQKKLLTAVVRARAAISAAEERYTEALRAAKQADIPRSHVAEALGIDRRQVYRDLESDT
jgi:hypothetical protein